MRVETEEKYYCIEPEKLIKIAEILNFKKIKEEYEVDEYFTDIDSKFIKNRTCLRIRKQNNKKMEITYKGKSDSLLGLFCKLENNINVEIKDYDKYVNLFSSLGYFSYVIVEKKRLVYQLVQKNYRYSIMIDTLPEIGGFVEFEIISEQNNSSKKDLQKALYNFVNNFKDLKLKEASEPYRDIVAKHLLTNLKGNKKIVNVCIDLDSEVLKYEKDFYKKYKNQICKLCEANIKWTEYKKNNKLNIKIKPLIEEYLQNLIFDSNNLLVATNLLNQISYKKYFFTKANEIFCECFFNKLNIVNQNILFNRNNNISSLLKQNKINVDNCIIINKKDFKENNSLLIMIINEI